jgi:hypothetical protein
MVSGVTMGQATPIQIVIVDCFVSVKEKKASGVPAMIIPHTLEYSTVALEIVTDEHPGGEESLTSHTSKQTDQVQPTV